MFSAPMTPGNPPPFGLSLEFVENHAVVRVRGETDLSTAPGLLAVLEAALDQRPDGIVVDIAGLELMDASGILVLTRVASALRSAGTHLTVASPQGDDEATEAERRTASFLAGQSVVRAALRLVVEVAEVVVDGADAATISLAPDGHLTTVIAGAPDIAVLDEQQYAMGEGPSLEAAEAKRPMHVPSTAGEHRWPTFIPAARERGVNSILSTPLQGRDGAYGALNMYAFGDHGFPPQAHGVAGVLADRAARMVETTGAEPSARVGAEIRSALLTRQSIAMAQGVLMAREGLSPDAAYVILRQTSQNTGRPLRDVAARVLRTTEPDAPGPSR